MCVGGRKRGGGKKNKIHHITCSDYFRGNYANFNVLNQNECIFKLIENRSFIILYEEKPIVPTKASSVINKSP